MVTMLPSQYTSEARIYADTRSILQPLLRGLAIQVDPTRELSLMVKTLLSRSNLETMARNVDADVQAKNSYQYEQIIKDLESNIKIHSTGGENIYTISYSGSEPVYVKNVVQAALNVFVENTLSEQRIDTDNASKIITTQINEYEARLVDAEQKLAAFKREYLNFMPGTGTGYRQQLEQNKASLEAAQLQLNETQTRFESVRSQMYKEQVKAKSDLSKISTEYDDRIEALQQRLDELQFRYTESHPDVIETSRQLKELQDQKKTKLSSYTADEMLKNNQVYLDLKLNYSQIENEVASLNTRVEQYKSRITELQTTLDKVPDVEAKLTSLTRNYDITKEKYEQLLSRKESALISKNVDNSADDIKFRIIDPPRVPAKPSGPPRVILLATVLILSVGSGVGLSFVISQISPIISSSQDLVQSLELPVLGVVSATEASGLARWEKRKMRIFVVSSIVLFGLFAAFIAVNMTPLFREYLVQSVNVILYDRLIQG